MADLSKLSDAELQALYSQSAQPAPSAQTDLSKLSDDQLKALYGQSSGPQLEFPDAPTTAALPISKAAGLKEHARPIDALFDKESWGQLIDKGGSMIAAGLGPLLTDNPKARAQIIEKNLPGTKQTTDKYGNPMIETGGKSYYTSRPGEIDAMDIGRVGLSVAAGAPAAAIAPVSIPGAVIAGAATNAGLSLAEDAGTRALGGTEQQIDPVKAGVSAAVGGAIPLAASAIRPVARALRGPQTVDPQIAARQALSDEFGVNLTRGQTTNEARALSAEDNLRYGREGNAARTMENFDTQQDRQIADATNRVRQNLTGLPDAMSPAEIGDVLGQTYQGARNAARTNVTNMYTRAFDGDELARAGISPDIPIETVYGLRNNIENAFLHADRPGGPLIPTAQTTPNTMAAMRMLEQFSETGGIPSAFPRATVPPQGGQPLVTGINWNQMDLVRKILNGMREGARNNPTDLAGMRRVLDVFDEEMGRANPLLNQARQAHMQRVQMFDPQRTNAQGVNSFLSSIANDQNPGKLIYDKIFNGNALKNGTAGPLIQQLGQIIETNPQATSALREGMMNRLLVNAKTGEAFSPRITANNIRDALQGQSADMYRMVFGQQELAQLQRYGQLLDHVGTTRAAQNPSRTSYNVNPGLRKMKGRALGALAGHGTGIPGAEAAGYYVGGKVDDLLLNRSNMRAAERAITPYVPPAPPSANPGNVADFRRLAQAVGRPGVLSMLFSDPTRKP